ncbi:MAG: dihydrofolate reductase [Erysipelotrichia bacterium]|nr:dihydrofolate reductase [Erysipelotrichia bacterium]
MISFSVAFDKNKGIGIDGHLPWHIKEELQLFKKNTFHKNIIMGQTTYQNLPQKLKERKIYLVTREKNKVFDDVIVIDNLEEFLLKHQNEQEEYIVCGGASIYRQAYSYCQVAYVSVVNGEYNVDTYFDAFDFRDWMIKEKEVFEKFTYYKLERK